MGYLPSFNFDANLTAEYLIDKYKSSLDKCDIINQITEIRKICERPKSGNLVTCAEPLVWQLYDTNMSFKYKNSSPVNIFEDVVDTIHEGMTNNKHKFDVPFERAHMEQAISRIQKELIPKNNNLFFRPRSERKVITLVSRLLHNFYSQEIENNIISDINAKTGIIGYTFHKNNMHKYINKNKISILDSCVFMMFIARTLFLLSCDVEYDKKIKLDIQFLAKLGIILNRVFKTNISTINHLMVDRFNFYEDFFESQYCDKQGYNVALKSLLEEFKILLKMDVVEGCFKEFSTDTPLYILRSFEDTVLCDMEATHVFNTACSAYNEELSQLQEIYK